MGYIILLGSLLLDGLLSINGYALYLWVAFKCLARSCAKGSYCAMARFAGLGFSVPTGSLLCYGFHAFGGSHCGSGFLSTAGSLHHNGFLVSFGSLILNGLDL